MDASEREQFIKQPRTAVLATTRRDGRIHAVPVWFRWDGVQFHIITERGTAKHRNAVRAGRASLCIDDRERFTYVTGEGPVTVQDIVSYDERLALHTLYRGPEKAREVVDKGGHEKMVLLLLRPEHWLG
jgi:PPOX class probable F420-dependent enzyme